jgi:outer membrane protein OmpA-like peptidoglycan-associated protein
MTLLCPLCSSLVLKEQLCGKCNVSTQINTHVYRAGIALLLCLLSGIVSIGCHTRQQSVHAESETASAKSVSSSDTGAGSISDNSPASTQDAAAGGISFPTWSSNGTTTGVPLIPGLTVVTAIAQDGGDYESIKRIDAISTDAVSLNYRADNVDADASHGNSSSSHGGSTITSHRTIRAQDLQNAHMYAQTFGAGQPDLIPGSTAISVSQEVLAELKQKESTAFTFQAGGLKGALGSLLGGLGRLAQSSGSASSKEANPLSAMDKEDCTLKRVGEGRSAFPVLLNDQRTNLPAIHAQCSVSNGSADFYILDNPDNPLMLAWKLGDNGDTLQVVKISYVNSDAKKQAEPKIEEELQQNGQADVYGIYFDFGSDKIKPESEPVLREIADALNHNTGWKLRVEGHTDNIGGDDYNNRLSQQRAEAVKQALVTRYHIAPGRLAAQGFGSTQPRESNETLAGRARNRRVELVRE